MMRFISIMLVTGMVVSERAPLVVDAPAGRMRGKYLNSSLGPYRAFRGIPFSEPPTGENRWRPPQPLAPWGNSTAFDATATGAACPQLFDANEALVAPAGQDEACLTLNVLTPISSEKKDLPVLFYIYGGSFTNGDTSLYTETGSGGSFPADDEDIIFVVANYRLGLFGYLATDALLNESGTTGNYGQQDQRAALEWVIANIAAFGGDPAKITIAGESAGGISVAGHLVSPQTPAGAFRGAYMESGTTVGSFSTLADATAAGAGFVDCALTSFLGSKFYTGAWPLAACADDAAADGGLACLRAAGWEDLLYMTAIKGDACPEAAAFVWQPTIDGFEWSESPQLLARGGRAMEGVRVAVANVADEGSLFTLSMSEAVSAVPAVAWDGFLLALWSLLGDGVQVAQGLEAFALYRPGKFAARYGEALATWGAFTALVGDLLFQCPNRALARDLVASGHDVHVMRFALAPACWTPSYPYIQDNLDQLGVFHESDVQYFFRSSAALAAYTAPCNATFPHDPAQVRQCAPGTPVPGFEASCPLDAAARDHYWGYLTQFVRAGDPNNARGGDRLAAWPRFNEREARMRLDGAPRAVLEDPVRAACGLWDQVDAAAVIALINSFLSGAGVAEQLSMAM